MLDRNEIVTRLLAAKAALEGRQIALHLQVKNGNIVWNKGDRRAFFVDNYLDGTGVEFEVSNG